MPHRRRRRRVALIEPLEIRRLLTADAGDVGTDLTPVASSAPQDGTEIAAMRMMWSLQSPQTVAPTPDVAANVLGGTASTGRQIAGALTGKTIFTSAGHGFTATATGWSTQRDEVAGTEIVEDLGNQDQMTFFVNYAFNAGATVVPFRPVGYQPNEVEVDNDDPQVTYSGAWSNSTSTIYYGSPGDVPYRFASVSPTETATARYTPNIPMAGFYPVYTWVKDDTDRTNQLYKVVSTGGETDVRVDHRRVGKGFVYLGTYYFNAGTAGYVEISNQSTDGGSVVIADAIQFGNGMGDINRGSGVSGQTRSDEASLYWVEHMRGQGVSSMLPASPSDDQTSNVGAPPRQAAFMNREGTGTATSRLFLSFHSNSSGGRGDLGLYNGNNNPATATPHQFEWASIIGNEVNDDMVALSPQLETPWANNNSPTLDRSDIEFGEINNLSINNEFDATILEVAYHDDPNDVLILRDPRARDWVARASIEAAIKYFNTFDATPLNQPPETPTNVRATAAGNGDVTVSWTAPVADGIGGDAPSGYEIYTSGNGLGFGHGIAVAGGGTLTYTIPAATVGGATYFRVAATNAGGESMPSEVLAARAGTSGRILIVNGFDRLRRQQNVIQHGPTTYVPPFVPNSATFERVRPLFSNSGDYASRAGEAIKAAGGAFAFDTTSNEALITGQVSLSGYAAVIWMSGEESTQDHTFDATEQSLVTTYLNAGGKLFVSGSEIGWDLDSQGNGVSFYNNQLKADFAADDANTYTASGVAGTIFAGITLGFDDGTGSTYNVDFPDKLNTIGGSITALNYTGTGSGGAAIQYTNPNGGRVVNMGFPFETITTAANRNSVMSAVLNFFGITGGATPGAIAGVVFRDNDSDGVVDAGETPLAGFTVFLDTNANGNLDGGETSTTTLGDGSFSFPNLTPTTYTVQVLTQTNYVRAFAGGKSVIVGSGQNVTGANLGLFKTLFTGTGNADTYTIDLKPADVNNIVRIWENLATNQTPSYQIPRALLLSNAITLDTQGGDDVVTIDFTNGTPLTTGGVIYAAGAGTNDQLMITGSSSGETFDANANGTVGYGGATAVAYTGLESLTVNAAGGNDTLNFNNPPGVAVALNGQTGSDTLNINSGAWVLNADAQASASSLTLNVAAGANVTFNATQHLEGLNVSGTATTSAGAALVLVTKGLTIPAGGQLDLKDNDLVVDWTGSSVIGSWNGSAYTGVTGMIAAGRNGGAWNGSGVISSLAQGSDYTTFGVREPFAASIFSGQSVDATSVLVKFTYGGDASFDGKLNIDDYTKIDSGIAAGTRGWLNGDFNYDGKVNIDDYVIIDNNIGTQGPAL